MTQFGSGKRVVPPAMNIYTVLVLVAFLALAVGVAVVFNFSTKLSGQKNPWYVLPATADQQSVAPAGS